MNSNNKRARKMAKPKMRYGYDRSHAKTAARRAREYWGNGWQMLSNEARTKAVEAEVLWTLSMIPETVSVTGMAIRELHRESLREAGLLDY